MLITARKIAREVIWQCTRRQARPLFFWAVANDKNELVVMHPEIDSWKSNTKERYEEQKKRHPEYGRDALVIHALTRYYAIEGKILKHAIRVASWQPPNETKGHLESSNETALAHPLGGMLDGRFYGPIVAFIYHLDPEFNYNRMSTADFRHVVDIFQNSMWNPMIGDVDRYPGKAVSALLMPDPATTGYITKDGEPVGGDCNNRLGTHEPIVEVNIPTMINFRQTCWHTYSGEEGSALRQLCVTGITWDLFLLGPLLLELPWIGRNALISDVHAARHQWPARRWVASYAKFLTGAVCLGYKCFSTAELNLADGMLVVHASDAQISPLHLVAYDEFMYGLARLIKRNWILQKGKTKILNE
ncbi:hypothetical protein QL093DRAFT_2561368 [Fusarium oxysporum]|nr:hypothetical protein QL093DRAFT_2561368 [Fusarium oxysporum]